MKRPQLTRPKSNFVDWLREKDLEEYTKDMARIGWLAAHVAWDKVIPEEKRKKLGAYCIAKFEKRTKDYHRVVRGVSCPKRWDHRSWRHFNEVVKRVERGKECSG